MNIMIASFNNFPNGDAGSVRQFTFGKLLKSLGHNVFFVGMGCSPYKENKEYLGFEYTSLRLKTSGIINKFINYFGYSSRLEEFFNNYNDKFGIDVIWVVDIPINALITVKKFAQANNILLIHDSVEWYSKEQFKFGRLSPAYIMKDFYNRHLIDKQFKVIAISKFLEKHFKRRSISTVRIPVILDIGDIRHYKMCDSQDKLILMYAGSPGKKDYLKELIEGLALLSEDEITKTELRVLGVTLEQIIELSGIAKYTLERVKDSLKVLGRVSREFVFENLSEADFTVLLRSPVQRYAQAGFPTKVVESLATGTPVILNITSDLGDYITDMQEGLIVEECSAEAVAKTLKRALILDIRQKESMRNCARKCAERNFDYRRYAEVLNSIIVK